MTVDAASGYVPADDTEILEVLVRPLASSRDEVSRLRDLLSADPHNVQAAASLAQRYLDIGVAGNDPRFYGYAQAVIEPWWSTSLAPPEVLRLRAKLKEKNHRYPEAIADLRVLIENHSADTQAMIELANLYRVIGRYAESRHTCDALAKTSGPLPVQVCLIPLLTVTGDAETAYRSATELETTTRRNGHPIAHWALTMRAVIARALGDSVLAEKHFREALDSDRTDTFLFREFADLLLDQQRNEETVALLRAHTKDNGILLRAAIAARRAGQTDLAQRWQSQLEARFVEIRLRGDQPHGRYESRYALELEDEPRVALSLALNNWQRQKETRDSRNLLEAAVAANDQAAALAVRNFLTQHGTQDAALKRLIP